MNDVAISVLVVTFNHEQFIARALESIRGQVTGSSFEVVVADDDSTDSTLEIVGEWAKTVPFPVRILPRQERLGITRNYFRGFSACHGEFVAVLEGDDEWVSSEKLERQASALRDNPDLSMVANRILLYDERDQRSAVIPLIGNGSFLTRISARELADENWFATFSACMYRSAALAVLSPEIFEATAYDWLINMAVMQSGDAAFLPQVMTLYRIHGGGQWSRATAVEQDRQIQSLIPDYIRLLGSSVDGELTRKLRAIETRLSMLTDAAIDADDDLSDERGAIRIARVVGAEKPRVSVVMASYNHEAYILDSINSVLDQTMQDFELILVDDGSVDGSVDVAAAIDDPRLRIYPLASNVGAASALNIAIQQSRAELIAVINSDDMWEPGKLARQLEVMTAHPELGGVFTAARFVAEDGSALPPARIPVWSQVFRQPDRTRAQWLRFFFENGNALCHPSALVRRELYELGGLYDNRLRQIPDLKMWIALVKLFPIVVLGDEELVRFRLLPHEQNASSASRANVVRGYREHLAVDRDFFADCPPELFIEAFGDVFKDPMARSVDELACERAMLWLTHECVLSSVNREAGLVVLRELLGEPRTALLLQTRYGLDDRTLHDLSRMEDGFPPLAASQWLYDDLHYSTNVSVTSTVQLARTLAVRLKATPLRRWPSRIVINVQRALGRSI